MKQARLQSLLHQYFNNTISNADCIELLAYLNEANVDEISDIIDNELFNLDEGPEFKGKQAEEVLNRITADLRFSKELTPADLQQPPPVVKFYQKRWLQIAAAALVFVAVGLAIIKNTGSQNGSALAGNQKPAIILPGGNYAILTMTNGKTISLQNAANGLLATTGSGSVQKTHNGQIVYKTTGDAVAAPESLMYNTLTTPRGGEYQVVLPDGTKVWLNAASSLSYPVAFTGNERHVKLTGEAYFEVAKNKDKPFYVSINNVQVRVLGTHFNISAYGDDDEITTTLLEGSVQVTKNNTLSQLKPGEQAIINNGSDKITVSQANIDDAMAWKNGYFIFNDDNVVRIMKKVSRWYDVDVEYQGSQHADQQFGGTFYRSKSITELLEHMEKIGKIHFKITGRRIIVMD